ncbi:4Fe-4S binding protein [Aminipila butyrica]|uniref:4Fe-4S binding protein n=1 Tax=Aminipila butyrica TaxID=433296 RepID=A0A858BTS7_9FIRM|nr:4Fe-4S binding protein [Aminipila butyrica]QIB69421.1 4Fe-4S binding protein [Aminipila butyrica]
MDKKRKNNDFFRFKVQVLWALITNSFLIGFVQGKIYQGKLKNVCVPGLNCYSCPGAIGSCPIGALQAVIGSYEFKFSFYVVGFLIAVGAFMGRFACGWLCPFGLFQELLYKIPFFKKVRTFRGDRQLRYVKYVVLVIFVILMPLFVVDIIGQGAPYFCKLICPAGTLEGGWPLVLTNKGLQETVGWLYAWKNLLLVLTIVACLVIYRPFCKYICPLGAIYSLFNPVSLIKYKTCGDGCTNCGACQAVCKMTVNPAQGLNDLECIRCGRCAHACASKSMKKVPLKKRAAEIQESNSKINQL